MRVLIDSLTSQEILAKNLVDLGLLFNQGLEFCAHIICKLRNQVIS